MAPGERDGKREHQSSSYDGRDGSHQRRRLSNGGEERERERSRGGGGDQQERSQGHNGGNSSGGDRSRADRSRDSRGRDAQDARLPPPGSGAAADRRRTPPMGAGSNSLLQEAAKLLRKKALSQAGLGTNSGTPEQDSPDQTGNAADEAAAEEGEIPSRGDGSKPPAKRRHAPIVWKGAGGGDGGEGDRQQQDSAAAGAGGLANSPAAASPSNPSPLMSPPPNAPRGTPVPSSLRPTPIKGASNSPAPPHSAAAAAGGDGGVTSELEAIKEQQKSMGFDPDAPVPLKSSPSCSSDDNGMVGALKQKISAAQNLQADQGTGSRSPEAQPQVRPKASRWMDDDEQEVEQPRVMPAAPEDEVEAMRALNNKELEEVEGEQESSSASERSPIGPGDLAPVRRAPDMLQECRSVFLYEKIRKLSEGTYGVVYKAREVKTDDVVALKKVKMVAEAYKEGFPRTAIREMNILVQFHHPNIVNVTEVVVGKRSDEIYMVMEYMEHDMKIVMEQMKHPFSVSEVKQLMLQLIRGVGFLHKNWIIHRDLKTSNILYNNKGQLKVCDFGLARQFAKDQDDSSDYVAPIYTNNVVTLWYRGPELLLGSKVYSSPLDVWSCGCIMAEFLTKKPFFMGKGELDQIRQIFEVLGQPTEERWPGFSKLPVAAKLNLVGSKTNRLRSKFPKAQFAGGPTLSDAGFDLLNRMLEYDPSRRITCEEAEDHEWFREAPLPKECALMPTFPVADDAAEKARKAAQAQRIASAMMSG